ARPWRCRRQAFRYQAEGRLNMSQVMEEPLGRQVIAGAQMLFVAFGALVLMPLITGMDPNVALFTAGIGTLLFQLVTKRQVPVLWRRGLEVRMRGSGYMDRQLTPVVIAPVIISIGLALSPVAVNMAMGKAGDGSAQVPPYETAMMISMPALVTTLLVAVMGR